MSEGLDATVVLPSDKKPSKQYRTSPYTVAEYGDLPYAQRMAVDAACNEAAGLAFTTYDDETSEKPYTVGRATKKVKSAQPAQLPSTTSQPSSPMTTATAYVHPAPSPALHYLNTPEVIEHDETHPDNAHTHAVPAGLTSEPTPDFASLTVATTEAAAPAAPAAPLAHDGTVYETTEYNRFHLLPENRDINQNHVRKLVGMIQKSNLLHLKPLDVTPDLGIIDGQHRWAAAKELGLPIFYKVGQQLSEADITTLNTASRNWQGPDWMKYYAVKRKPAYVALYDFMKRHPRISFSNAKIMLSGSHGGRKADDFRAGKWDGAEDVDMARAEQVAELVERISVEVKTFKQPTHTGFVTVLYQCIAGVEGFEAEEMMRTILLNPRALVPCASHKQWVEMLSDIYNYRKHEAKRIPFKFNFKTGEIEPGE